MANLFALDIEFIIIKSVQESIPAFLGAIFLMRIKQFSDILDSFYLENATSLIFRLRFINNEIGKAANFQECLKKNCEAIGIQPFLFV
jgi:hypothetical protein